MKTATQIPNIEANFRQEVLSKLIEALENPDTLNLDTPENSAKRVFSVLNILQINRTKFSVSEQTIKGLTTKVAHCIGSHNPISDSIEIIAGAGYEILSPNEVKLLKTLEASLRPKSGEKNSYGVGREKYGNPDNCNSIARLLRRLRDEPVGSVNLIENLPDLFKNYLAMAPASVDPQTIYKATRRALPPHSRVLVSALHIAYSRFRQNPLVKICELDPNSLDTLSKKIGDHLLKIASIITEQKSDSEDLSQENMPVTATETDSESTETKIETKLRNSILEGIISDIENPNQKYRTTTNMLFQQLSDSDIGWSLAASGDLPKALVSIKLEEGQPVFNNTEIELIKIAHTSKNTALLKDTIVFIKANEFLAESLEETVGYLKKVISEIKVPDELKRNYLRAIRQNLDDEARLDLSLLQLVFEQNDSNAFDAMKEISNQQIAKIRQANGEFIKSISKELGLTY